MAKIKSIIVRSEIDKAKKSHNCRANSNHRIMRGDTRFNVRNGRSWLRYCTQCAENILERDIKKLEELKFNMVSRHNSDS